MESGVITCLYSCHGCGLVKRPIQVPERLPQQDIAVWMADVQQRIADDHCVTSPACGARVCDLMIPMAAHPNARVGERTKH